MTMTDDLVKRWDEYVESMGSVMGDVERMAQQMRNRIKALTAERDEAINQLDSAIHSQIVLEKRTAAVMEDRKLILEERARTFALMLARAEKAEAESRKYEASWMTAEGRLADAEAERDKAYASGYSDAETEISKSALGQRNDFLHSQYANAADRIEALTDALIAKARIEALTAERERLALAICGGEDAPGYANAQTVETLEHVAKQNQLSHGETINSLLAAKAENERKDSVMTDLRPCPFCGETPFPISTGMAGQPRWQHPNNDTCPIAGHYFGGWNMPEHWNTRAALTGKDTTP